MNKFLITAILLSAPAIISAAPLSPEASLKRALGETPANILGSNRKAEFKLRSTYQNEGVAGVYLYSRSDGKAFIVTPADDASPALLGYGTTGVTDISGNVAPGCEYWLNELARQVTYGASQEKASGVMVKSRPERAAIQPLCSTQWNQSSPYNEMCPSKNGEQAVTGCVATAMAQVMKYHNWPDHGVGKKEYACNPYGRLRINYDKEPLDWDNMLDTYTDDSPQECKDAVARLMKCTGYSVSMGYSPQASGAASIYIAEALGLYFKYDKGLSYLYRDNYSLYDWEDMIYASLTNDGPVIYDGQSGIGGHSFVCDGYGTDGFFHFNWGWGGISDGYFLLDALDPLHQGIGGADGGFDYMQDVVIGIRPDTNGDSTWNATMIINNTVEYSYYPEENAAVVDGTIFNIGPGPLNPDASIGLRFTPMNGGEPIDELVTFDETVPLANGFTQFGLEMPELQPGEYMVEVIYSLSADSDEVRPVLSPLYESRTAILTIGNGEPTFEEIEVGSPDFLDTSYPAEIDLLQPIKVTGRIENPTDEPMLSILTVTLLNKSITQLIAYSNPWACDLEENESREMDINTLLSNLQAYVMDGEECYIALSQLNVRTGAIMFLSEPTLCVIKSNSGVDTVTSETDKTEYQLIDLQGNRLDGSATEGDLPKGIYIVKAGGKTTKLIK
ncbi:MAG: hypothetical protein HDR84_01815 [Bacteroides sp.]|nr:hypothetical protein [Bacteroides sp.]